MSLLKWNKSSLLLITDTICNTFGTFEYRDKLVIQCLSYVMKVKFI